MAIHDKLLFLSIKFVSLAGSAPYMLTVIFTGMICPISVSINCNYSLAEVLEMARTKKFDCRVWKKLLMWWYFCNRNTTRATMLQNATQAVSQRIFCSRIPTKQQVMQGFVNYIIRIIIFSICLHFHPWDLELLLAWRPISVCSC